MPLGHGLGEDRNGCWIEIENGDSGQREVQLPGELNGREAHPMETTRSDSSERLEMMRGRVPLVAGEAVGGKDRMASIHPAVAGDFGEDRGGRDAAAPSVPLDQRGLPDAKTRDAEPIDDHVVRSVSAPANGETPDRKAHRAKGGASDVVTIDPCRRNGPDPPGRAPLEDRTHEAFPLGCTQKFGIAKPRDTGAGKQDDRRRDDRARKTPPPHFIRPRNPAETGAPESGLPSTTRRAMSAGNPRRLPFPWPDSRSPCP